MNMFTKCSRLLIFFFLIISSTACSVNPFRPFVAIDASFPNSPVITPFADHYWLLTEDLHFNSERLSDGRKYSITVPAGFVTDLASIPAILSPIYDNTGNYASAGILHDYLYWTQFCDRRKSDRLIKEGLKATYTNYLTRNTIKYGVYAFGGFAWCANAKDKSHGHERYVPVGMRKFSAGTRWHDYQKTIPSDTKTPWDEPNVKENVIEGCNIFVYD